MSQGSVCMGVFLGIMDYAAHMNNFVNQDTMVLIVCKDVVPIVIFLEYVIREAESVKMVAK